MEGFSKGQADAALIKCNNDPEAAVTTDPRAQYAQKPEVVQDRPSVAQAASKSKAPESAFDFKRKSDGEQVRKEGELTLQDIRALRKEKYMQFQADPNAKNSAAYQKPASVAAGGKQGGGDGWFDWMWNSSSSGGGGSSGGGSDKGNQKPRMRTVADLPPTRKAGG
uniref:UBA domain-containing protein n=1 Tax=Noctiluca scintillans TaxID=2966 RepID=A0A7S1AGM0_NOCSC|mmetsp:Transcript_43914/g.116042  ORF Transcript_43914/g.116042 Transcript_43914/m.116042 type:complete len:166 (+) Transcript_43914:133-630(+)